MVDAALDRSRISAPFRVPGASCRQPRRQLGHLPNLRWVTATALRASGLSKARIAYMDGLSISVQDSSLGLPGCYWRYAGDNLRHAHGPPRERTRRAETYGICTFRERPPRTVWPCPWERAARAKTYGIRTGCHLAEVPPDPREAASRRAATFAHPRSSVVRYVGDNLRHLHRPRKASSDGLAVPL